MAALFRKPNVGRVGQRVSARLFLALLGISLFLQSHDVANVANATSFTALLGGLERHPGPRPRSGFCGLGLRRLRPTGTTGTSCDGRGGRGVRGGAALAAKPTCSTELGQEVEKLLLKDVEDEPGEYLIISTAPVMVGPSKELSPPPFLAELPRGTSVEVLEVQTLPKQERVRGRLADGWISLQNLGSGFRWAWPRKHQDAVTLKLGQMQSMQATLKEEDQEDLEAEADLLYLKALLSRASMGLPALKSFQSESPSKTWALFGRGLEQWDSVAGDHSYEVPLTAVSEPLRRELFRALGSKAYIRDLVNAYTQEQLQSPGQFGDFLERFRKVKDTVLTDIGGASGLSLRKALTTDTDTTDTTDTTDSQTARTGSWTQEDLAQWLQVFTAVTSSTRVVQADAYFGHAAFGLCLRRLCRRFELALSLQRDYEQAEEAEEAGMGSAMGSAMAVERFKNFVEMVSRPSSEDATMDEVLKLSSAVLSAIRRQTESLFGTNLRDELQKPLDRAKEAIKETSEESGASGASGAADPAASTPPIGKLASLLLESAEAGELRMLSVSKMGAKERIMWDALSFGYFLQEAEDNLLLTV